MGLLKVLSKVEFFFLIGSLLLFFLCFRRSFFSKKHPENLGLITMCFLMIFFNFPIEGAWGSLLIPVFIGKIVSEEFRLRLFSFQGGIPKKTSVIIASLLLGTLFSWQTYRRAYSGYLLISDVHNLETGKEACRLNPDFWKHCVHVAEVSLSKKRI